MKCLCWNKITVFSKDFLSHSLIIEKLSEAGLNFYHDDKLLSVRFNVQCERVEELLGKILQNTLEGYSLIDIKCWGKEAGKLQTRAFIETDNIFSFFVAKRSEKEIKIRVLPFRIEKKMHLNTNNKFHQTLSIPESFFVFPLSTLLRLLPEIEREVRKLSEASSKES
ncbi:MAG: hypothetical protein QW333_00055 [Fervidicoccaceae archaeon]